MKYCVTVEMTYVHGLKYIAMLVIPEKKIFVTQYEQYAHVYNEHVNQNQLHIL